MSIVFSNRSRAPISIFPLGGKRPATALNIFPSREKVGRDTGHPHLNPLPSRADRGRYLTTDPLSI